MPNQEKKPTLKTIKQGTSLEVQWLRLHLPKNKNLEQYFNKFNKEKKISKTFWTFLLTFTLSLPDIAWRGQVDVNQFLVPPSGHNEMVELVCNTLFFLWELVSSWPDSEYWWEWWHILAIRLEATESSGGWISLWQLQAHGHLRARDYRQRSTTEHLGSWEWAGIRLLGKIRDFLNCHIYRRIGGEKSNCTGAGKMYPQKKAET